MWQRRKQASGANERQAGQCGIQKQFQNMDEEEKHTNMMMKIIVNEVIRAKNIDTLVYVSGNASVNMVININNNVIWITRRSVRVHARISAHYQKNLNDAMFREVAHCERMRSQCSYVVQARIPSNIKQIWLFSGDWLGWVSRSGLWCEMSPARCVNCAWWQGWDKLGGCQESLDRGNTHSE